MSEQIIPLYPLRIRLGPPVCSGLGKNGVRRGRHLIHTEYLHNYRLQTYFYNANFIEYPKDCSQRPKFVKIKKFKQTKSLHLLK